MQINETEALDAYESRRLQLSDYLETTRPTEKHAILYKVCSGRGTADFSIFESNLKAVINKDGESDFQFQPLIRILYLQLNESLEKEAIKELQNKIIHAFEEFPFWPIPGIRNMDKICFWSENHLFMTLSGAYLYYQYLNLHDHQPRHDWEYQHIECQMLEKYLIGHLHHQFQGMYETNSHVYLPYSMIALLNLYDFAMNMEIKCKAEQILDRIVYQLMLGTDLLNGIGNLTGKCYFILYYIDNILTICILYR
jgi:hypothetical protein